MYALVFALALGLAGCSKDKPIAPASKVNPSSDDIISPPGLFPDPSELSVQGLNTVGRPDKFDIAADVLWGSILGTEKKDMTLVRALDGISVLISGVVEIDGREHLYLGIDREDFRKYDIAHLRSVLETRFPDIPIYIEESDGVDLLTTVTEPEEIDLFSDDFSDLEAWTVSGDWKTETFSHPVPDEETDNTVALIRSTDCSGTCTLTTEPLDLSGYSAGTLSLHRWLDDAMKAGDAFVVQVGNDGLYRTVGSWDNNDGDDVWHHNTFTLNDQDLGEKTTVRVTVTMSAFSDLFSLFGGSDKKAEERIAAVDNVLVRGTEVATVTDLPNLVVHDVSVTPGSVESGIPVTIRYSVKNIGIAQAGKENVSVYRHTSKTRDPAGGTLVNIFAMQSPLEPDAGFNREVSVETPSVSRDTAVYYYVCVDTTEDEEQTDDNCGSPAVVVVKADKTTETPEPDVPAETPAATCENLSWYEDWDLISSRETAMGGDAVLMTQYGNELNYFGTIGLGGLETKGGVRGFVTAAHNVAIDLTRSSLSNTNSIIGQTLPTRHQ